MTLKSPPADTPRLYEQDGKGYDAIVHAHYFLGGTDWMVTEYDPDDEIAFGWVCLNGDREMAELGDFSIAELREVRAPMRVNGHIVPNAIPVEYDEHWQPKPLCDAITALDRHAGRQ